ncbi:hypothetical protein ACJ73_07041 [Blastomyces percursus]|uniref:Cystathionine beta-lyase n=1 Tax=Blastomyces percursus TaxID=1658174 RepID=A0A1J9PZ35_9EURO|nr:hypothetical protein ACJ73_07041 [Blastomyces percursus]
MALSDDHPSTRAIHADDPLNLVDDVAPPIHLSTTFRFPDDPKQLVLSKDPIGDFNGTKYVYSREFAPNATRFEAILSSLLNAPAVVYSSALAALHAALVLLNPRRISVSDGYHGSHEVIAVVSRLSGLQKLALDCPAKSLEVDDVILLETPVNPLGTAFNIEEYAKKAHGRGAYLIGQHDPFLWGADIVMHSGTKYLGGHSDLLCGVLATKNAAWVKRLFKDQAAMDNVLGNLEGWLGVRSLRTPEVRVQRASQSCAELVSWLRSASEERNTPPAEDDEDIFVRAVVEKIYHASLQEDEPWLKRQMPNGFGPVFSIVLRSGGFAQKLPSKLKLFHHATSLGGVNL